MSPEAKTPDAKVIEELKAEHGEIYLLQTAGVAVVVKPPSKPAMKRFTANAAKEEKRYEALESLLRDAVVWPDQRELSLLIDRKPGVVAPFGEKLAELAGAVEEADFRPL